ncbi:MAG: DNA adenine methylase [Desulfobacterales bacterium]|nr:DNA adenine methylase [Desulfobacterales bacterium]
MKSPLAYIGGKSRLAKQIISQIPDHRTYVEAFSGAAWVFFSKEESKIEVINDLDSDLVTFYRCVQNHLEEFLRQFRWLLSSRQIFEEWKEQISQQGLTDIQRAARYYYLQRLCFGGRVKNRSFGISNNRRPKLNLLRIEQEMSDVHLRLCGVHIENLPAEELIKRYDHKDTFFYCDPPYYKKPFYKHNMKKEDYIRHADRLAGIEGKFLYSINDHPVIREIFKDFKIEPVTLLYTVGTNKAKKGKELLISNY